MEHLIAVGVGLVVGGGILTLVWRILSGGREEKALDEALDKFAVEAKADQDKAGKSGKKKKKKK